MSATESVFKEIDPEVLRKIFARQMEIFEKRDFTREEEGPPPLVEVVEQQVSKKAEKPETHTYFPSIDHGKASTGKRDWAANPRWYIQEKIDGTQFSFTATGSGVVFSCGKSVRTDAAAMFRRAIGLVQFYYVRGLLCNDHTYHCEMLETIRQNIVEYERVPKNYFIVYDISRQVDGSTRYFGVDELVEECERIGFEYVPAIYVNTDSGVNAHEKALELVRAIDAGGLKSVLGGTPEGVVLKCPNFIDAKRRVVNSKIKYVTPKFEEVRHLKKPERNRQTITQFVEWVGAHFDTPARHLKAEQHLASRQDITRDSANFREAYLAELDADLIKEHSEMIRTMLQNESPTWLNPRNERHYNNDPLFAPLRAVESFDVIYTLLLPEVCRAARASA
jgi:hypothetical protein